MGLVAYLVQRAGEVVVRESVLLKEVFLDDSGDLRINQQNFRKNRKKVKKSKSKKSEIS